MKKIKTALITGGGGLLGPQHAIALAKINFRVILIDINKSKLLISKKKIEKEDQLADVRIFVCDITNEKKLKSLNNELKKKDIFVDVLINNAAMNPKMKKINTGSSGKVENYNIELLKKEIDVSIIGSFLCSKIFGSVMASKKGGVIINIASDLAINAPDHAVYHKTDNIKNVKHFKPIGYSISKFGLIGLTKYLATYWAKKKIRCNALIPGAVLNKQPDFLIKNVSKRIPMGRWANEKEYRKAIQFLATDASSYMTGQMLIIDGGRTTW